MKRIFFIVAFVATVFSQNLFAQNVTANQKSKSLIDTYYNLKDALVAGNAGLAATASQEFKVAVSAADAQSIPESIKSSLLKNASQISVSKSLAAQRELFATLSADIIDLAKKTKLSQDPVYQQYCPMKNSYWLSKEKAVKNPYFGSSMLTCGKVTATL